MERRERLYIRNITQIKTRIKPYMKHIVNSLGHTMTPRVNQVDCINLSEDFDKFDTVTKTETNTKTYHAEMV